MPGTYTVIFGALCPEKAKLVGLAGASASIPRIPSIASVVPGLESGAGNGISSLKLVWANELPASRGQTHSSVSNTSVKRCQKDASRGAVEG